MARAVSNPQIVLRPQDLLILLRLTIGAGQPETYARLAGELGISVSEIHGGLERAILAQLAYKNVQGRPAVVRAALKRFVLNGARYAFPATRGGLTRGMVTGYAAAPLVERIVQPAEPPPVWPDPEGTARGVTLYPLYPSVPKACRRNPKLYEVLALFDALRSGSAREQALATDLLEQHLA